MRIVGLKTVIYLTQDAISCFQRTHDCSFKISREAFNIFAWLILYRFAIKRGKYINL